MFQHRKYLTLAFVAGLVVAIDQITKAVVARALPLYDSITVIAGFFNITHVHNPGGAFGFLADQSILVRRFFFLFISMAAVGMILYLYRKTSHENPLLAFGLSLIFGGAVGNLIDRIRFEKVTDFLDFYIGRHHWPTFNIADSAISVGIAIFVFCLLFKKMPE